MWCYHGLWSSTKVFGQNHAICTFQPCRIAGDGDTACVTAFHCYCSTSEYSESSRSCLRPGPRSARQLPRAPRLAMSRRTATRPSSYCSDLDIDSLERRFKSPGLPSNCWNIIGSDKSLELLNGFLDIDIWFCRCTQLWEAGYHIEKWDMWESI